MAQVFSPTSNTLARIGVFALFTGPVMLLLVGSAITRSSFNTNVDVPIAQPVPFSHEHHAIELGIDCRYCHNSVENAPNPGLPTSQVCMSCHSQIWTDSPLIKPVRDSFREDKPIVWNQVNWVPRFVYFPHDIHIARGISCNDCHGPIQKMMITEKGKAFFMVFCLNCHRKPEQFLSPKTFVWQLYRDIQRFGNKVDTEHGLNDKSRNGLTPREYALAEGEYRENQGESLKEGMLLKKEYHIHSSLLTNCSVCHH